MRIHIVTDRFTVGGGIEHIYQLVKGIKGIDFAVFAEPGNAAGKFAELDNVEIFPGGYDPGYVLAGKPDLVHIHHLRPLFFFFKRTASAPGIPIIFTAHGLHIHKYEFSGRFSDKIKYTLRFFLEKMILKKPDKVIAVSKEDQRFLQEKYRLKNTTYLTNGIDFTGVRAIRQSKEELRKELNFPAGAFLFVTVARFDFQKGYDILLKAISLIKDRLAQADREVRFLFVGGGSEFDRMKEYSRELSVSQYISFLGERDDVYKIVKAADLFLLSSRWEGLPIVLLETGLLKTPVLATDTYGNREILAGGNGILCRNEDPADLAEKIAQVLSGKFDLEQCARKLYLEVENNYNLPKMLAGLEELYRSFQL
ncbi:MAG: glycosyltransferase family 4 protein [Candidatus Aminicenantes bacterium]|nr:glycosyltransferase family 4 protein [Candidatus Aminicenantes bacterium]